MIYSLGLPIRKVSWLWLYMPIILAPWEAGTGGLQVQGQPQQLSETLKNLVRTVPKYKIKRVGDEAQF